MKIYLYKGGLSVVRKSGVGSAVRHQEQMLSETGAPVTEHWKEATAVHYGRFSQFLYRIQPDGVPV